MPLFRRRTRPLFDDSEHETAERQAREQADFDALLVELWGPMEPPKRIVLVRPEQRKKSNARLPTNFGGQRSLWTRQQ